MSRLVRVSRREIATAKQSVDPASCRFTDSNSSNSAPERDNQSKEAIEFYLDDQLFNEGQSKNSDTTRYFPPEIWFSIVFHSVDLVARCHSEESSIYKSRPKADLLRNLGSVSKLHRKMALRYWVHSVKLREQFDLEKLLNMGIFNGINLMTHVRHLVCKNEFNIYWSPQHTFMGLNFLEELELHCHQDIRFEEGDHATHPLPEVVQPIQMFYRRLKVYLPATLRTLRVYDSHTPDIYFIRQVIEQCPLLQSLTLSRCTLFTRQECKFWKNLPQGESDSYFSDQGVPAYASAVAGELKGIKNLRELEIGIYLTPHAAIGTHLQQHTGLDGLSRASLKVWEEPCEECNIQYREPTLAVEAEATEILAREIPTLSLVSWASFCSEKRIGWSTHRISRNQEGNFEKSASVTK